MTKHPMFFTKDFDLQQYYLVKVINEYWKYGYVCNIVGRVLRTTQIEPNLPCCVRSKIMT